MSLTTAKPVQIKTMEQLFMRGRSRLLSWRCFWGILMKSPLNQRVHSQLGKLPVSQCCEFFYTLSCNLLNTEELAAMQVLSSMLFLLPDETQHTQKARATLLRRSFQLAPTVEPMMVHYFTENLLKYFQPGHHLNSSHLLGIANYIATKCAIGKAVAVCLLWSIIYECGETEILIHQYRELSTLCNILNEVCVSRMNVTSFGILLRSIGTLLHLLLCGQGLRDFLTHGYPASFFRILPQDVQKLIDWVKNALEEFALRRPGALQRARYAAKKLLTSLDYLDAHGIQWCLVCRDAQGQPFDDCIKYCVLSDIRIK
ncbi:uncharacterized protein LOC111518893 [Drosophila willistoni]|uniref:uncharacterized protein LOC111518893 n=1 Tax=Drosophila willistoni TaxID=7260 RepID=UPI001F08153D|nr:uncharacterized protein LOC111518893 [Drosophila willistoni]